MPKSGGDTYVWGQEEPSVSRLLREIPELVPVFLAELAAWGGDGFPGFITIAQDVMFPHLAGLLRAGDDIRASKADELQRFARFLDSMADSPGELREALVLSILEALRDESPLLERMMPYLGFSTRRLLRNVF